MTQTLHQTPAPTFAGRIWNFTRQMFPIYPNVVIFLLQFIVNYLMIRNFFPLTSKEISLDGVAISYVRGGSVPQDLLLGSLSLVLFVYLFRAFDEVKDYPTDKINFPDRPLVAGVLSLQDIKILQILVIVVLIALNVMVGRPDVWIAFSVVMGFTLLASQWFFFERQIRDSLPLALVTHNPVLYLYQLYILSFFSLEFNFSAVAALIFLLGDAFPGTAWEISRKIRGTTQEDTYTTYSKIWGRVTPCLLVLMFTGLGWIFTFAVARYIQPDWVLWFWMPAAAIWFFLLFRMFQFWKSPQVAPPFRQLVEAFKFALILAFVGCLIFGGSSIWPM